MTQRESARMRAQRRRKQNMLLVGTVVAAVVLVCIIAFAVVFSQYGAEPVPGANEASGFSEKLSRGLE